MLALDGRAGEISVVGRQGVGAPVEFLQSRAEEEFRVFVVTERRLKVLRFDNLEVLDEVEFRGVLDRAGLSEANISGMTVGDSHVYLTLEADSRVVRVKKPSE